jgi:AcrR family transcriptional regulator
MSRSYNSTRRAESAARTRQAIIDAAVRLHGKGVTALAEVAREAGVALPTVTKHFPTRDDLFRACTSHFNSTLQFPSPEALASITNQGERLREVVRSVYGLHEISFGQAWTGYRLEEESQVMKETMVAYEAFVDAMAAVVVAQRKPPRGAMDNQTAQALVRGLLSPLTYRALRLKSQLEADTSVELVTTMLAGALDIEL